MRFASWALGITILCFSYSNPFIYQIRSLELQRPKSVEIILMGDIHNKAYDLNYPQLQSLQSLIQREGSKTLFIVEDIYSPSLALENICGDIFDRTPSGSYKQTLRELICELNWWFQKPIGLSNRYSSFCPLIGIYTYGQKKGKNFINVDDRVILRITKDWSEELQYDYGITAKLLSKIFMNTVTALKIAQNDIITVVHDKKPALLEYKLASSILDYYQAEIERYVPLLEKLSQDLALFEVTLPEYNRSLERRLKRAKIEKNAKKVTELHNYRIMLEELVNFYNHIINYKAVCELFNGIKSYRKIYVYLGGYHCDVVYKILRKAGIQLTDQEGQDIKAINVEDERSLLTAKDLRELYQVTHNKTFKPIDPELLSSL
ncbi:MAG TPA: hypothetical protein VHA52_10130 [Candidatus Babeliaceae bacterium]|nr:hypothetical protein [Candidatus Babeliaceae bacterium]